MRSPHYWSSIGGRPSALGSGEYPGWHDLKLALISKLSRRGLPSTSSSRSRSNIWHPLNNTWPFSSMQLPSTVAVGSTPGYSTSVFLEEKKPSTPYLPVHCASLAASESLAILSHLFTLSFKGRLGDRGMYLLDSDSQIVSVVYDLVQALKLVWDPELILFVMM